MKKSIITVLTTLTVVLSSFVLSTYVHAAEEHNHDQQHEESGRHKKHHHDGDHEQHEDHVDHAHKSEDEHDEDHNHRDHSDANTDQKTKGNK